LSRFKKSIKVAALNGLWYYHIGYLYFIHTEEQNVNKAIFWDFDGTLVYSYRIWQDALLTAITKFGYEVEIGKIKHHLSSKVKRFSWHNPDDAYVDALGEKWWRKLFESLNSFYDEFSIKERNSVNSYFKEKIINYENYKLYENAKMVLQECTDMGYKNYILSNNYPELPSVIEELGIGTAFIDIFVSANIGYEKPNAAFFQHALKVTGFPDVSYMIGDNPIADIQGGKSAGMKTILVHNDDSSDADYMCKNLSEIPGLLD